MYIYKFINVVIAFRKAARDLPVSLFSNGPDLPSPPSDTLPPQAVHICFVFFLFVVYFHPIESQFYLLRHSCAINHLSYRPPVPISPPPPAR